MFKNYKSGDFWKLKIKLKAARGSNARQREATRGNRGWFQRTDFSRAMETYSLPTPQGHLKATLVLGMKATS